LVVNVEQRRFQFNLSTYTNMSCGDVNVMLTLPTNNTVNFKGDCLVMFQWSPDLYNLTENDNLTISQIEPAMTLVLKVQSIKNVT
jgi:hypothetical protein